MNSPLRDFGASDGWSVAEAPEATRTAFIHETYQHLAFAIGGFMLIEIMLFRIPGVEGFVSSMLGAWWLVLLAFMGVSMIARRWAVSTISLGMQYLGLGLYVAAEAVIFLPLLWVAVYKVRDPNLLPTAGLITALVFGGLTAWVHLSKKDFSFIGGALNVIGFAALGLIVTSLVFGFSLGILFACAMAVFAAGSIVYETSNILHHYRPGQHVAAALALFASVALLFWYVLRILMSRR
jgi:FtsH-binding integral membrane protein